MAGGTQLEPNCLRQFLPTLARPSLCTSLSSTGSAAVVWRILVKVRVSLSLVSSLLVSSEPFHSLRALQTLQTLRVGFFVPFCAPYSVLNPQFISYIGAMADDSAAECKMNSFPYCSPHGHLTLRFPCL